MAYSANDLLLAAQQLEDLAAVVAAKAQSAPADMALLDDVLNDAATLLGPPASILAPVLIPLIEKAIVLFIAENRSADPGSLTHIASGKRGS